MKRTFRLAATLPVTALLAATLLAGCHKDEAPSPTMAPNGTYPGGPPTAPGPGGPGGTMMNTPSQNPSGAPGDAVITGKVKSALIADSKVKAGAINVDTKSNVVVLRGSQPTQAGITEAVAVAKKTQGVKNVINQLTVKP